jgi:ABC-type branched-subunit amino acid transport system substrate-binding protein
MKTALFLISISYAIIGFTQEKKSTVEVGLFSSLNLDQHFNHENELINPRDFPKQTLSALEFYEGAALAIDSLNAIGKSISLKLYDVQSYQGNISKAFENGDFDQLDMIIAQVGGNEFFQLAIIAKEMNIPIINATYPNTRGITASPDLYIVNPRINVHLELIYQKIGRNWKTANIVWFTKEKATEKQLENIFGNLNSQQGKIGLKYKTANLNEDFNIKDVTKYFDSIKTNVWILGSFDEAFATKFVSIANDVLPKEKLHLIGMPNWESLKEIQAKKYANMAIYYTMAFYLPHENLFVRRMDEIYKTSMGVKSPTMALKGFEITYYFCSLLEKYKKIKIGQPGESGFKVLTDFDFQPVILDQSSKETDFIENKHIRFIRRLNNQTLPYF